MTTAAIRSVVGLEQRAARAVQYAQELIADRAYFVGDRLTLADISVSCGLALWREAASAAACQRSWPTTKN